MTVRPLDAAARARIQRRFEAIPERLKDVARGELEREATAMADEMKRGAPVDEGDLIASIVAEDTSEGTWLRWRVSAGGPRTTKRVRTAVRDSDAAKGKGLYDYANAIEHGHMTRPDATGKSHKVEAQPFFWPVYRRRIKRFKRALARALRRALEQPAPGGG